MCSWINHYLIILFNVYLYVGLTYFGKGILLSLLKYDIGKTTFQIECRTPFIIHFIVITIKLWNWKTTFRFKLSNEHKTNKLCCVNILISLNTWLDLSHCINIWCETTSNTIDHIINVVFIFYSFLVLTVSIEVF